MILAKKWLKSLIKNENGQMVSGDDETQLEAQDTAQMSSEGGEPSRQVAGEPGRRIGDEAGESAMETVTRQVETVPADVAEQESVEEGEDSTDEGHREQLTEGEDDPLAPAYDLDDGELMDDEDEEGGQLPWSSRVEQARDFFNSELLYRFDLLERGQRESLRGAYRIEVRGNQGGIWTFTIGDELSIVNRREEADTVISCFQRDFLQIVNGEINPQLAILAQKMRITGDLARGISVQSLLSPQTE